jgi:hypothetical protein
MSVRPSAPFRPSFAFRISFHGEFLGGSRASRARTSTLRARGQAMLTHVNSIPPREFMPVRAGLSLPPCPRCNSGSVACWVQASGTRRWFAARRRWLDVAHSGDRDQSRVERVSYAWHCDVAVHSRGGSAHASHPDHVADTRLRVPHGCLGGVGSVRDAATHAACRKGRASQVAIRASERKYPIALVQGIHC